MTIPATHLLPFFAALLQNSASTDSEAIFDLYQHAYSNAYPLEVCFGSGPNGKRNQARHERLVIRLKGLKADVSAAAGENKVADFEKRYWRNRDDQDGLLMPLPCGRRIDKSISKNTLGRFVKDLERNLKSKSSKEP